MTMRVRKWFRRLIERVRGAPAAPQDAEAARSLFQTRYHALRLLLAANTKALELMATMEGAANGADLYGMGFVRSHCTALGVSVFQMVRHLDTLAPEKYAQLFDRLQDIQQQINEELATDRQPSQAPLVVPLNDVDCQSVDFVGAKMANLGEVATVVGMAVPDGFVISSSAFELLIADNDLQTEIDRVMLAQKPERFDELFALSSRLQQLIMSAEIPQELEAAIDAACVHLVESTGASTFALRSSALGEDSAEASFAGQYQSLLNVRHEHLLESYLEVVASKYTPQAMIYRYRRGLRDDDVAMSVGCLQMVNARSGGVAYTGNPGDDSDRNVYISSAWGLPKAIVDGRFASDLFVVARKAPRRVIERTVGTKITQFVTDPVEGVQRTEVPIENREEPSLSNDEALTIADHALRLEEHFGTPVDVEWAMTTAGEVVILQCRPLLQSVSSNPRFAPADAPDALIRGGVTASPGTGAGPIHWVRQDSQALSCPEGAVLALEQPLPRWAALLGRVAAVVAEEGGVAGHLATVSRELGVPALLGVGLLAALEEGAEVTVDAGGRAVYPGRIESLLADPVEPRRPMDGSPVRETLQKVLQHIAPLNLIDPDSIDFRPANCQTLHDITRFCHEQAVREVFAFGADNPFPEYASKQLYHNVPMQWWVLDLENGFKEPVTGRYVHLDEIACRPMLALWDGMVAVPWDGPPAVSGRGLASILFEATANPALSSPFKKPYADRNYFIISKHFMNLQSRFGFHFTNVEALAGSRPEENYLSFSFKGGAADLERKVGRARLIGDLLSEMSFEVNVTEDVVTARRTGIDRADVEQGLRVVGYLLMHTRQLDMIMNQPAAVEHYRSKMRADIEGLGRTEDSG
jgi:pyruvate,water dikinase